MRVRTDPAPDSGGGPPRPIGATYRLQLGPDLDFAGAAELVDHLAMLGVTHLYLSPSLQARPGSTHGYDVADPTAVSAELGGEAGLRALAARAHAAGLGLVLDIVPNHLGTGAHTPLWEALLSEGHSGSAGAVFDVDWDPPLPGTAGKVVLPVLGSPYGEALFAGEIGVVATDRGLRVTYYDHSFPLAARSVEAVERIGGLDTFDGTPGEPLTWSRLHGLLEEQHYRLVWWRAGDGLVNYRRFFAIDELAGVRVEDDDVFDLTHRLVLELVRDGVVDGLRVDHPDGLRDPERYLRRLAAETGGAWTVVEKIIEPGEPLPPTWPVAGTTGYEFANDVLALYVDPQGVATLAQLDLELGGDPRPYAEQARAAKLEILDSDLAAEVSRLSRRLWRLSQRHLEARDVDEPACRRALQRTLASFDVYRTYVDPVTGEPRPVDLATVARAARAAADADDDPRTAPLYPFLRAVLTGGAGTDDEHLQFLARFQQLSGAAMAKGVEDTVFYRARTLLALNEVGGSPEHAGVDVAGFHERNADRARLHPAGMLTTSTHDTKRSEDVRLRMAALSELADEWVRAVGICEAATDALVVRTPAGPAPDPQTRSLLLQTLIGVWPLRAVAHPAADIRPAIASRLSAYGVKASREAGLRTSWTQPDEAFEAAIGTYLDRLLDPDRSAAALRALAPVARQAAEIGMAAGLASVVLRSTSPGMPDTYQGTELWDDSLVDPDNRRPVDHGLRRRLLVDLANGADAGELWSSRRDGRVKLHVLHRVLRARLDHPSCFADKGAYVPILADGRWRDHVVAFARTSPDGDAVVTVVPRLTGAVLASGGALTGAAWSDTALSLDGAWTDVLTGAQHDGSADVSSLFAVLPVAVLAAR